jgi:polysaccharide export outer membrane protein
LFDRRLVTMRLKQIFILSMVVLAVPACFAQQSAVPAPAAPTAPPTALGVTQVGTPISSNGKMAEYRLGAGDQILIRASNAPELSEKLFRIDPTGFINAPTLGRVEAGGLTVAALEKELDRRLGVFLQEPDAAVSVMEYQSQPVSIFGEVLTPGVHQLQGRKTLVEMLSTAGGIRPGAGPTVRITRKLEYGRIPLPGATDDATGQFSVAQLELKPLVAAQTPERDIEIEPYDIISVPRAELIYVAGDVNKSGPLALTDRPTMSVVEALSASGGVTKTADTKKAHILRTVAGNAARAQLPVNVSKIMAGKSDDIQLMAGDILVVPPSAMKKAAQRALEAAIQIGTVVVSSGAIAGTL